MSNIVNIKDLRDHALETLDKVTQGRLDTEDATAAAKLYQTILSSLKTELEYHKMLEQKPNIEFLNASPVYELDKTGKIKNSNQKLIK